MPTALPAGGRAGLLERCASCPEPSAMCRPNAPQVRASCSSDIVGGTGQPCRRSREAHDDCVTITGRHSSWCRGRGGHDRCHHRRLRCVVRSAFHHVGIVGLADHGPERPDVHRRFAVRDGLPYSQAAVRRRLRSRAVACSVCATSSTGSGSDKSCSPPRPCRCRRRT